MTTLTNNEITVDQAAEILKDNQQSIYLLDVRQPEEYQVEHLKNSKLIPLGELSQHLEQLQQVSEPIIVYCQVGRRSLDAVYLLKENGISSRSIAGGVQAWSESGYSTQSASQLTASERSRYSRQMLLPELGLAGQEKLKNSKVLLIGLGGLGSPIALYLGAAGVNLGLIDDDQVEQSNLQRQVIHKTSTVGLDKVTSAQQTLNDLNPDIQVETYKQRLTPDNALQIIGQYDLIIDGTDNFPTRYLVNDIAVRLNKPVVSASILSFSGQITSFVADQGPCYRCLYPTPPPPELAPSCSAAGVLGVMAGVVGLFQANEAIKLLLNIGENLIGKLMIYESLTNEFISLNIHKDDNCLTCGVNADHNAPLPDYQEFCAVRAPVPVPAPAREPVLH
jgi:molybdopterin/thiamine biosynthesis adenylyltransferase/rhodanese-related sulfurtransferase